jgi:hypothetical protein
MEWCFLCGEFIEYILAFTDMLDLAEQRNLILESGE